MADVFYLTAKELADCGAGHFPKETSPANDLIYSSPATLSYNSPGANGFGVKRAGLALPESVMLLVSPTCCGRNSTILSRVSGYAERMFYLEMTETDLVTGRHLQKIPLAVQEICQNLRPRPRAVLICMTCVDALLGTDLERVCRKAEEAVPGIHVVPSYMYALTREGTHPPMVSIRESLYLLLKRDRVDPHAVNLLGFFAPLRDDCELYSIFRKAGLTRINEISRMEHFEDYQKMGNANFNLVLNAEADGAAEDLAKRLKMPYVQVSRVYSPARIARQYELLGSAIGVKLNHENWHQKAKDRVRDFRLAHPRLCFSIGQRINANPFELAADLLTWGYRVAEIFATPSPGDLPYLRDLAALSPDTKIYLSTHPSMVKFDETDLAPAEPHIALGMDAGLFRPSALSVPFCGDVQPFGYTGLIHLLDDMEAALKRANLTEKISAGKSTRYVNLPTSSEVQPVSMPDSSHFQRAKQSKASDSGVRELMRYLSPFAPDLSGAEEVLFDQGGIIVILDAGGCTGNVCGFDEPRWFVQKSAVFSAGLRGMDAILGRDRCLIEKLGKAVEAYDAAFIAFIGTPVPSVIGTDFRALSKMAEKRYGVPVISVPTTGMRTYDRGMILAYKAFLERFPIKDRVLGALPLDLLEGDTPESIAKRWGQSPLKEENEDRDYFDAEHPVNLAVSPAGIFAAKKIQDQDKLGFAVGYPLPDQLKQSLRDTVRQLPNLNRVLVIHQAVLAEEIRSTLENIFPDCHGADPVQIRTATFFEPIDRTDFQLQSEGDLIRCISEGEWDLVIGDPLLPRAFPDYGGAYFPLRHFAVSGDFRGRL